MFLITYKYINIYTNIDREIFGHAVLDKLRLTPLHGVNAMPFGHCVAQLTYKTEKKMSILSAVNPLMKISPYEKSEIV